MSRRKSAGAVWAFAVVTVSDTFGACPRSASCRTIIPSSAADVNAQREHLFGDLQRTGTRAPLGVGKAMPRRGRSQPRGQ